MRQCDLAVMTCKVFQVLHVSLKCWLIFPVSPGASTGVECLQHGVLEQAFQLVSTLLIEQHSERQKLDQAMDVFEIRSDKRGVESYIYPRISFQ